MKKKHNVFFLSFIVIFSLVLLSSQMVIGINAKFLSSDSATDEARVASFKIEADVTDGGTNITAPIDMMPGSVQELTITVKSSSEVAVKVTINVETAGNLPLTISEAVSTFDINAGGGTFKKTITISWDGSLNDAKYSGEIDIVRIFITTEQAD